VEVAGLKAAILAGLIRFVTSTAQMFPQKQSERRKQATMASSKWRGGCEDFVEGGMQSMVMHSSRVQKVRKKP
jgi:hypothetical protein